MQFPVREKLAIFGKRCTDKLVTAIIESTFLTESNIRLIRLTIQDSHATNDIDLGSDHRAVKCCFNVGCGGYQKKTRYPKINGWKPILDGDGLASDVKLNVAVSGTAYAIEVVLPPGEGGFTSANKMLNPCL